VSRRVNTTDSLIWEFETRAWRSRQSNGVAIIIGVCSCLRISGSLASRKLANDTAEAVVVKDAGEDIDATNKMEITAIVKLTGDSKVTIKNGKVIAKVTKPGLQVPIGESAINPVPRSMITAAVKEVLPAGKGVEVTITAPEGEKIATKTLNAKLGIIGGVSILGTTGVVKPLSLEAYRRSLVPQIDVALARGYKRVFFVPGNIIYEVKDHKLLNVQLLNCHSLIQITSSFTLVAAKKRSRLVLTQHFAVNLTGCEKRGGKCRIRADVVDNFCRAACCSVRIGQVTAIPVDKMSQIVTKECTPTTPIRSEIALSPCHAIISATPRF
jgi:hypothetical protein